MTVEWIEKKSPVEWLGAPPVGVGALDVAQNTQGKALLASWNSTDGNNCINSYGLQPNDVNPTAWGDRDGWVLACFVKWWNASGKTPKLPEPGTKNGIAWVDLSQQNLSSLQQWAVAKGVINPGQIPVPPTSTCVTNCQNLYGLDPLNLATCLASCAGMPVIPPSPVTPDYTTCAQNCVNTYGLDPLGVAQCLQVCVGQVSPSPIPQPPQIPPSTTPPVTPPSTPPVTPPGTITKSEEKTSILPWVIGGAALLGLGALWFGKTPVTLLANEARERVQAYLVRVRLNRGGYDTHGRYWGVGQPLYQFEVADSRGRWIKSDHIRATDRAHAKDLVRRRMGSGYDVRFTR